MQHEGFCREKYRGVGNESETVNFSNQGSPRARAVERNIIVSTCRMERSDRIRNKELFEEVWNMEDTVKYNWRKMYRGAVVSI